MVGRAVLGEPPRERPRLSRPFAKATFLSLPPFQAVPNTETFHDRFLIIDDKELYLIGASLKDLGHKCFGFTKMDAGAIRGIKKLAFRPAP